MNRPPLPTLLLSLVFKVLGVGEWQLRLTLVFLGCISIVAFYRLALQLGGRAFASIGVVFFAFTFQFLFNSTRIYHFAFVLPVMLLCLDAYYRSFETRRGLAVVTALCFLSCLMDLSGISSAIVIAGHRLWIRRRPLGPLCWPIAGAAAGVLTHLLHIGLIMPTAGRHLNNFWAIVGRKFADAPLPSMSSIITVEAKTLILRFSVGLLVLALMGGFVLLRRRTSADRLLLLLPLLGIEKIVFFRYSFGVSYQSIMWMPWLAMMAAVGTQSLLKGKAVVRAIAFIALGAWVAQSVVSLIPRLTRPALDLTLCRSLGLAVRDHTETHDRLLLLALSYHRFDQFYHDHFFYQWQRSEGTMIGSSRFFVNTGIDDDRMAKIICNNELGVDVVVASLVETLPAEIASELHDDSRQQLLQKYQIASLDDPIIKTLEGVCIQRWDAGGYRFYRLRR